MLGHRGCRLAISYPEIAEMQARAIFEAAIEAGSKTGSPVVPEIMVPLVGLQGGARLRQGAHRRGGDGGDARRRARRVDYLVGTMIELPRAALRAAEIAETAEFFSFGTNDLTQTTFGISRDDAASFLGDYPPRGIIEQDPFVSLDHRRRRRTGAHRGRARAGRRGPTSSSASAASMAATPPRSAFCEEVGLDYVSCSPFRVPIARLAAAQAAAKAKA